MTRKIIYPLLAILLLLGVYALDYYVDNNEKQTIINEGKEEKESTNVYFLPTSTTNQIVHHENYSLSYSENYEQAEWVAYELKKSHLVNTNFKRPYFELDDAVSTKSAHWKNYKKSGYTRGHLCPAGDRRFSKKAHDETFLTSNVSPQIYDFNAGVWNRLEQKVRYWASRNDGVFVVTGGILKPGLSAIGSEKVAVPEQFYKVILDYNKGNPKMLAFLMNHESSKKPLYEFVVSTDTIEALTNIDFFPQLDDAIENKLEASKSYNDWNF